MANPRFNKQVAQPRVARKGGGMGGRSGDMMYARGQGVNMRSKRVPTELMDRGAMKKGGKVGKKKQGYNARKDESIAMRIKKKRTKKQLKASRDESYGRFGSKMKKKGKINR
jgi:Tfp pilus assembly protein FimT